MLSKYLCLLPLYDDDNESSDDSDLDTLFPNWSDPKENDYYQGLRLLHVQFYKDAHNLHCWCFGDIHHNDSNCSKGG